MKIDLHVHIKRTSNCAKDEPEVMAKASISHGLRGLVLLDHNYQATKDECSKTESLVPGIKLFRGIEMDIMDDHVILISTHDIDFAPKYKEKATDLKMLSEWVEKTNSLAILSHPFRYHDISIDLNVFRPHAIELASMHIARENRDKIAVVAQRFGMKIISVSDAHKSRQLGGFCIDTDYDVSTEEELISVVKAGKFTSMETQFVPIPTYSRNEYIGKFSS